MYIISDLHGAKGRHIELCRQAEESNDVTLQIGDLGYNYDYLIDINSDRHKFFPGNHENYNDVNNWKHNLGDYGVSNHGGHDFFWIRGEFSIDYKEREKKYYAGLWPQTWFREEEIPHKDHPKVIREYLDYVRVQKWCKHKTVVISHGCPQSIAKVIGNAEILRHFGVDPDTFCTSTQNLLEQLLNYPPDLWIFGHFHQNRDFYYGDTRFICIKDNEYLKLNLGDM